MPMLTVTDAEIRLADHHARVDSLNQMGVHHQALRELPAPVQRSVFHRVRTTLATFMRRIADLPIDSRDRLQSPEETLANRGFDWSADLELDRVLAAEIVANQQARQSAPTLPSTQASRLAEPGPSDSAQLGANVTLTPIARATD